MVALVLVAGCVEFLPGTDRALDASAVAADARIDRGTMVMPVVDGGARDTGVDPPGCGGHGGGGQPCCAGGRCNAGYVCVSEATETRCQRCGGSREPCCAGGACEGERTCVEGRCG